MKKDQDQPADAAELRRRAEEQLKRQRPEGGGLRTELETAQLVHELQVHQIELEMQNEELQESRANLEVLLAQYTDFYDFAPTGYFTLAVDGIILAVNLTGARLVGIERARLLNRRFTLLVSEADRPAFSTFLEKTFAEKGREFCEVTLLGARAAPLFVRVEAVVGEGQRECRAAVLDVTDRHRAEAERERLIRELQTALARVKMLSGLLPICGHCKKSGTTRVIGSNWSRIFRAIPRPPSATGYVPSACKSSMRNSMAPFPNQPPRARPQRTSRRKNLSPDTTKATAP